MELGPNVTLVEDGAHKTYIVGTAHISQRSVREVRETIEAIRPDVVCVELCQTRYDGMMDADRWKKLDIFQVIKQGKVLFLLANLSLSAFQRRMGQKLGVEPGAELKEAILAAQDVGAEVELVDRDIQATLKRTWARLSWWNKFKVLGVMGEGFFGGEEISEEDLEKLKEKDQLSEMMSAFAAELPQVQIPLIDERDRFLMSAIEDAPGLTKVAVVGAGHVEGMLSYRGQGADRAALSEIPPRSPWVGALKWLIPGIILVAFAWGYHAKSGTEFQKMLWGWIIPNSVLAALGALIARARPISVVAAAIASPITSLNPTLGAGMVVGLLEAWLRKPSVLDCEALPEDMLTVKGLYRNPVSRVLLVAALVTLGSALGAWVGAAYVVPFVLG